MANNNWGMGYELGDKVCLQMTSGTMVEGICTEVVEKRGIKVDTYGYVWISDVQEYYDENSYD
jgi:hypothetical protein